MWSNCDVDLTEICKLNVENCTKSDFKTDDEDEDQDQDEDEDKDENDN